MGFLDGHMAFLLLDVDDLADDDVSGCSGGHGVLYLRKYLPRVREIAPCCNFDVTFSLVSCLTAYPPYPFDKGTVFAVRQRLKTESSLTKE